MGQITRTNFGLVAETRLTNAQILTLFSAPPIVLVPARVGVMWVPMMLTINADTTAGAYATVATFSLGVPGLLSDWSTFSLAESELDTGDKTFSAIGIALDTAFAHGLQSGNINMPLELSSNADPTGGNVANFAIVRVFYVELPAVV